LPTAEGLTLYDEVDLALGSIERINSLTCDIASFKTGQLKLVAPPSFSEGVLPEIVAAFLDRYPSVHLTIDSRSVETTKSMIASGAADAGFIKLPFDRPDLRAEKVVTNETVCVVPKASSLARAKSLDPVALRDQPLVLLGLGGLSRAQIDSAFAAAGIRPKVRIETHTVGSACAFAARGLGVAIVNELLARPFLRDGIVIRKFKPRIIQEYAFVTSASAAQNRLAREFLDEARRYFRR
jgi:DNA-binding transcriptional LysR family regulator